MTAAGKSTATAAGEVIATIEASDTRLRTSKSAAGGCTLEPATHTSAAGAGTHAATVEAASSHPATKAAAVTTAATVTTASTSTSHSRRGKHES